MVAASFSPPQMVSEGSKMKRVFIAILALLLSFGIRADEKEAMALAESGVTLLGSGKVEKGKELLFKALAHDANCPIALFELGKIFEAAGMNVSAADFLARASVEFAKGEKSNPAYAGKRSDANRRLQKLNPYANQFTTIMEEYAAELGKIAKKSPDSMTAEEAIRRMNTVSLSSHIAAEKMPKIDPPKVAAKTEDEGGSRAKLVRTERGWKVEEKGVAKTEVAPDVERALKADGWTTITGVWKKLDGNKYEVTDGKLECPKLNGAVQVFVHKGTTGTVKVFVRTAKSDGFDDFDFKWNARGYGATLKGLSARIYAPSQMMGGTYSPYLAHESPMQDLPRHHILVSIMEKSLEVTINGKKEKKADSPIAKEGTFMIEIDGSAIIEAPKAAGQ
jgi:hypothetical protein